MNKRMKDLRKEFKMTQQELCEKLGVSRTSIVKYETGAVPLTDELIDKLTDIFNVTADYLLGFKDRREPKVLEIPDEIADLQFAFHRGEFEGLLQDEVDMLAVLAAQLKEKRKKQEMEKEGD